MDLIEIFRKVILFIIEWTFYAGLAIIVIKVGVGLALEDFFDGHCCKKDEEEE